MRALEDERLTAGSVGDAAVLRLVRLGYLSRDQAAPIREVIDGPGWLPGRPGAAWTPRSRLAVVFGRDLVAELVEAGWLADWPEVQSVSLTPLAAHRLQLRLEERPPEEVEIWVTSTEPERAVHCDRRIIHLPCLDMLPDRRAQGAEEHHGPRLAGGVGQIREWLASQSRKRRMRQTA